MQGPKLVNVAEYDTPMALIVDSGDQFHSVKQALRIGGFMVIEAAGVSHALDCVRNWAPRVVVVGESILPIYGETLLSELRGLTVAPIVVVGSGGRYSLVRALEEGADAYMDQSVTPVVFLAQVRAMIRRSARAKAASNGEP